jgi:sugar O-acyltransferase (sialic acid O-acetyltransferase NeuD family)
VWKPNSEGPDEKHRHRQRWDRRQASVILDACIAAGAPIVGWIGTDENARSPGAGLKLLGDMTLLDSCEFVQAHDIIVGTGNGDFRRHLSTRVLNNGGTLATVRHPSSVVSSLAVIGAGTFLAAQSAVGAHANVGRFCIINTGTTIDHDNVLADGVHFAGNVHCGEDAFIGVGASVAPGIKIGARAIVGAGAVVIRDVPDGATVVGNPARPIAR